MDFLEAGKKRLAGDAILEEFYQLLNYKEDVTLEVKLSVWDQFYNFSRPHTAHNGKTPYEILKEGLL